MAIVGDKQRIRSVSGAAFLDVGLQFVGMSRLNICAEEPLAHLAEAGDKFWRHGGERQVVFCEQRLNTIQVIQCEIFREGM